jgi:hypothetical protein
MFKPTQFALVGLDSDQQAFWHTMFMHPVHMLIPDRKILLEDQLVHQMRLRIERLLAVAGHRHTGR